MSEPDWQRIDEIFESQPSYEPGGHCPDCGEDCASLDAAGTLAAVRQVVAEGLRPVTAQEREWIFSDEDPEWILAAIGLFPAQ